MSQHNQQRNVQDADEQAKLEQIQQQFGAAAADYVTSKVHASGRDLAWLVEEAALTGRERVLDVATGGGHTAFALAPHAAEVVALDLTKPMLAVAQQEAVARQLSNISFLEGDAQAIPAEESSFEVVACRKAAHHFPNVRQAVGEWVRVLKPGGKLLLVDTISPEEQEVKAFLHEIEVLRDPSHVYSPSISEWKMLLDEAGFEVHSVREWGLELDVTDWVKRMRTSPESVSLIEQRLRDAAPAIRERLDITGQAGTFTFKLPTAMLVATKAKQA